MEGIPQIVDSRRLPVEISVYPHFFDHHIEGRAVLPAVEAMQVLAKAVRNFRPDLSGAVMTRGRFEKFLQIPADSPRIEAVVEMELFSGGGVRALLLTKTRSGKSAITRSLIHAAVDFPATPDGDTAPPMDLQALLEGVCVKVSPEAIYRELVPFGPAYRNISAPLYISEAGAVARIAVPETPGGRQDEGVLGSPFALDAAFHAACVWSQCYKDTVAFPVGFERRSVYHPTQPASTCFGRITPLRTDASPLVFDIWLYDSEGRLCECVRGAYMQDVSAGRLTPPGWIKRAGEGRLLEKIRQACRELCVAEIKTLPPFADGALSPTEKTRFEKMGTRRRQSFLAARLACKRISRRLSGNDLRTAAADIHTLCPDLERPCCRHIDTAEETLCSVSHDDRFVAAAAADGKIGIDVEKVSGRVLRSQGLFMSRAEQELVRSSALGAAAAAIRIWSVKEAAAKALNLNLAETWQRVTVTQVGCDDSRFQIDSTGPFTACHNTVDGHVFTLIRLP
ncbi:MAG: polyketide synthase dehydratase domain-containing protein [Thermodesulfobacteriota bacterium]